MKHCTKYYWIARVKYYYLCVYGAVMKWFMQPSKIEKRGEQLNGVLLLEQAKTRAHSKLNALLRKVVLL